MFAHGRWPFTHVTHRTSTSSSAPAQPSPSGSGAGVEEQSSEAAFETRCSEVLLELARSARTVDRLRAAARKAPGCPEAAAELIVAQSDLIDKRALAQEFGVI